MCLVFSEAEVAAKRPLSEECSVAINHVASYELRVSDAIYLWPVNPLKTQESLFLLHSLKTKLRSRGKMESNS